jgi:hypothetical protein
VALVRTDVSGELIAFIIKVEKNPFLRSLFQLLVTANVVSSSLNLFTLMMEAIRSFETSVLTRDKRCNISVDGILHSHRRENLKPYITLTGGTL